MKVSPVPQHLSRMYGRGTPPEICLCKQEYERPELSVGSQRRCRNCPAF
jgi:hypothetical protein